MLAIAYLTQTVYLYIHCNIASLTPEQPEKPATVGRALNGFTWVSPNGTRTRKGNALPLTTSSLKLPYTTIAEGITLKSIFYIKHMFLKIQTCGLFQKVRTLDYVDKKWI